MIKLIKSLLAQIINDLDSGNSNISEDEQQEIINLLTKINQKELSKLESANYIGVSRATFDNYINKGLIPKGHKRVGLNTLFWNKSDLDKYLDNVRK